MYAEGNGTKLLQRTKQTGERYLDPFEKSAKETS